MAATLTRNRCFWTYSTIIFWSRFNHATMSDVKQKSILCTPPKQNRCFYRFSGLQQSSHDRFRTESKRNNGTFQARRETHKHCKNTCKTQKNDKSQTQKHTSTFDLASERKVQRTSILCTTPMQNRGFRSLINSKCRPRIDLRPRWKARDGTSINMWSPEYL